MHRHRVASEQGPYSCAGGVRFVQTCSCGAQRKKCSCYQCDMQGTSVTAWEMPVCIACGLRHPHDTSCPAWQLLRDSS